MFKFKIILSISLLTLLMSCAPPVSGTASFTILSDQNEKLAKNYKKISGPVKDEMCLNAGPLFFFWWGKQPIHESLLADMLAENKADALIDATFESSNFMIPYIFMSNCVKIEGTPVVLKGKK